MAQLSIVAGATSQTTDIFILDSSKTDGSGLTGLAYNTASLTAYYNFPRGSSTPITLAPLASATAVWSSGGFKEIDPSGQPGHYRFDIPNALLAASNGRYVKIVFRGATHMADMALLIELTGWDNQLVPGAAGGMFIAGTNAATSITSGLTAHIIGTVDTVTTLTGHTPQTGDSYARLGAPAAGSISADIANVASGNGFFVPGIISTVTSASAITVYFAAGAPAATGLPGLYCAITSADHAPQKQLITTATSVDSTHLTLTFATPFGTAPSVNDTVQVG